MIIINKGFWSPKLKTLNWIYLVFNHKLFATWKFIDLSFQWWLMVVIKCLLFIRGHFRYLNKIIAISDGLRYLTRSVFCQISNTSQSCASYRKCSIHKLLTIFFFFWSFFFPDYLESYLQMPTSGLCNNSKEHLCRFDSYFSAYLPLVNAFLL